MTYFSEWYNCYRLSNGYHKTAKKPIAYFCMEYALPQNLPIYAGGLGVLAGDYVSEAGQQNFHMVGIGLFYSQKCMIQKDGESCIINDPLEMKLKPVMDKLGNRIKVSVPITDKVVQIQAWLYDDRTIPMYLLDTDIVENDPEDRKIASLLYCADIETRIKQEIILGIGGVRFLNALGIEPSIYHMNEGHSAFLIYEVAKSLMQAEMIDFEKAFLKAKEKIVFTNHTLVVGGHDMFDTALMEKILSPYANEIGVSADELIAQGVEKDDPIFTQNPEAPTSKSVSGFATTTLALRASSKVNAVSRLHAEVAKKVWPDYEMIPITNGVNISRWDKVGKTEDIVAKHTENKVKFLEYVKSESGIRWSEDDLVVGWARRIASYKRPAAFFDDLDRAKRLLQNKERPVHIVLAGNPHYADEEGRAMQNRLRELANRELRGDFVYLENYNTNVSELMVAGVDVWLNTPIVGLEACGTSGMKAALNGTLLCSTNDGWLPEVDLNKIGFLLDNDLANHLLPIFESSIAPLYYLEKGKENSLWTQKMIQSRQAIFENFGTDRMLKDYIEQIYEPILGQ